MELTPTTTTTTSAAAFLLLILLGCLLPTPSAHPFNPDTTDGDFIPTLFNTTAGDIFNTASKNPWGFFQNFSGCHMGDHRPGLAGLKNYFHRFGYIPDVPPSNFSDVFDGTLESAIKSFQQNFRLNTTGVLDASTLDLLVQPRCGVADIINGTSSLIHGHGRGLYAYFPGTPQWPYFKRQLTYAITSTKITSVSINSATLHAVFARAFARWAEVTTLSFSEVTDWDFADITIGFYTGSHGDGEPFDGVLGTLAHAFSPTDGRFHLDGEEEWVAEGDVSASGTGTAVDLESVAVHEIGHLLGLGHSSVRSAIMYPTIRSGSRKVDLIADDVEGIQSLYGTNPNYNGTSMVPYSPSTVTAKDTNAAGGGSRQLLLMGRRLGILVVAAAASLLYL